MTDEGAAWIAELLSERLATLAGRRSRHPAVTLSYAQSLDGSIARRPLEPTPISNRETRRLTHRLRSMHDAVLVGINTVIADDPRLNVRLTDGPSPCAVILDRQLRLPLSSRVLRRPHQPPMIMTGPDASRTREAALTDRGARIFRLPLTAPDRLNLDAVLRQLSAVGVKSVMVEGGSRIITSFLERRCVDQIVVTVSPQILGGVPSIVPARLPFRGAQRLRGVRYAHVAGDVVVFAALRSGRR